MNDVRQRELLAQILRGRISAYQSSDHTHSTAGRLMTGHCAHCYCSCANLLSTAMMKSITRSSSGRKGLFSAYSLWSLTDRSLAGTQGRSLEVGAMEKHCYMSCFPIVVLKYHDRGDL